MKITTITGTAAIVIVQARTVTEWRSIISHRIADPEHPAGIQLRMMLDVLDHHEQTSDRDPHELGVLPSPELYAVYPSTNKLPRTAWVVGWLDEDGYRHAGDLPVPSSQWLDREWRHVLDWGVTNPTPLVGPEPTQDPS